MLDDIKVVVPIEEKANDEENGGDIFVKDVAVTEQVEGQVVAETAEAQV